MIGAKSFWWALASLPLMIVGALGPWARTFGRSLDGNQDEVVLVLAVVAALMLVVLAQAQRRWLAVIPLLAGLTAATLTGNDIHDIADFAPGVSGKFVSIEWGIYLALLGSTSLVLASVLLFVETAQARAAALTSAPFPAFDEAAASEREPRRVARDARRLAEYAALRTKRVESAIEVDQPLALISQIQRSGGTLLSQLFDGHPQCHAHPHELKIGGLPKENWPSLDLNATPKQWFNTLVTGDFRRLFRNGYAKFSAASVEDATASEAPDRLPLLLPHDLLQELFLLLGSRSRVTTRRQILNCYMTSFFNAWLDNQNLYAQPKRVVTAFRPRLVMNHESVEAFFADYPDGWLIGMIREPKSWYVSASRHEPAEYGRVDRALELWLASVRGISDAKRSYGSRVIVVSYERLVQDTEHEMRRLAAALGIDFDPTLLEPTFNGLPIRADSSFPTAAYGVIRAPLHRDSGLDRAVASRIDELAADSYERAVSLGS